MTTWTVPGIVRRIIDADTLVIDLDQGWRTWRMGERVRLAGIDAPELNTPEGVDAWHFVQRLVPLTTQVMVFSRRLDKYGRVEGHVKLPNGTDLGAVLVNAGHAHVVL